MLYMTHACTPCVDSKLFLQTDWDIVNHPRHRPTWHVQLCVRIHSRHRPKWHVQVCVCVCVCVCAYMSEACIFDKDPSQVARRWAGIQLCVFFQNFPSWDVLDDRVFERAEVLQKCTAIFEPGVGALLGLKQFPLCRLHLCQFCLKCLMSYMCVCVRKANAI